VILKKSNLAFSQRKLQKGQAVPIFDSAYKDVHES